MKRIAKKRHFPIFVTLLAVWLIAITCVIYWFYGKANDYMIHYEEVYQASLPVHVADDRRIGDLLLHVQPVLPVVRHVVAAEGQHGHGIPAGLAHRSLGGSGLFVIGPENVWEERIKDLTGKGPDKDPCGGHSH